ncbi:MAG: A/G-specific adenine glycosylase [Gammaproteobacteria bacterium]
MTAPDTASADSFAARVVRWQCRHGRHGLPWQIERDPYRVWLSEIMLQQTQVATVIPYFARFVARFPDVAALAAASEDEVLALWSGLGYYSRARNLHAAARMVIAQHDGCFPAMADALATLPGIGRSTAAAISALAFGRPCAILDGNVKRVLARHGGVAGWPGERTVEATLWTLAEARMPQRDVEPYTQGLMDLGALICTRTRPACDDCPVHADCVARQTDRIAELPAPRPRRALPERTVTMLLLRDRDEVMLEKRPPRGIWGGLWSLPELAPGNDPAAHCHMRYGFDIRTPRSLPPLRHSFTHFLLHIEPLEIRVAQRHDTPPGQHWLALEDAVDAALPTPVRTLLARLGHC